VVLIGSLQGYGEKDEDKEIMCYRDSEMIDDEWGEDDMMVG